MTVLITGKGTSGSWQIRGVQIGRALGARVVPMATDAECRRADIIVAVKRLPDSLVQTLHKCGVPFVWDCVDAWPQSAGMYWTRDDALAWARAELRRIKPHAVIWPNARMRDDVGIGGFVLRHHSMPGQAINPIRERVEAVGYWGSTRYIETLASPIASACRALGAAFVVNPPSLASVDICLALRGHEWQSYPQQHWKPATKLANAHATGTPWLGSDECGYREIAAGGEVFAQCDDEIVGAALSLAEHDVRQAISRRFVGATYTLEQAAEDMKAVLHAL